MSHRPLFAPLLALLIGALGALTPQRALAESDVTGGFQLKLGGYYPSIDGEFTSASGQGPYATFYGTDWHMYGELEFNYYLLHTVGKLGLGASVGYSSATGRVQSATPGSQDEIPGETSFSIIPLRASLLYRYDYSAIHHGVPLVPAVKLGLDYYFWEFEDANGATSVYEGVQASGGKLGWHASLGLHLLLDFIDPSSAAYLDMSWGVNNSYFFAEYLMTRADGFGASGLDLSDDQWLFGLAFEF